MIKDEYHNKNYPLNNLLYNQIVEILNDEIKFPHRIDLRKKRAYLYYDNHQNQSLFFFRNHHLMVKIILLRSGIKLEFNRRILTLDTITYSSLIETLDAYHSVYSKRDKVIIYIPNDVNKSILNKLKDLVNSISLIEKINGQSKKVNQRMNSLKSERAMSIKKEYESEICPTFSKPK